MDAFPKKVVDSVLAGLFDEANETCQLRGDLFESYKGERIQENFDWPTQWLKRRIRNNPRERDQRNRQALYWTTRRATERRAEKLQRRFFRIVLRLVPWATVPCGAFMALMILLGIFQLGLAVLGGVQGLSHDYTAILRPEHPQPNSITTEIHGTHDAMKNALGALELVLLAPLPYLLVLSLGRYVRALAFEE